MRAVGKIHAGLDEAWKLLNSDKPASRPEHTKLSIDLCIYSHGVFDTRASGKARCEVTPISLDMA